MATIIDALLVTLGLDTKGFKAGAKDAGASLDKIRKDADKTGEEVGEVAKGMAEGFKQVQAVAMAVGAALIGVAAASKGFVEHLTRQDAAIGRSANNLGMGAQDLQDWRGAAERLGGTADGITGSIRNLTTELQNMQLTGKSAIIPFLVQAHVNLTKFFAAATSAGERLKMISDGLRGMEPARALALGAGMGLDEGTVNVLMNTRTALDDVLKRQREMNQISPEDAKAAIERKNAWSDLSDTLESFGRKLATLVTPALVYLAEGLRSFVDLLQQNLPVGVAVLGSLTAGLTALGAVKLTALTSALGEVGGSVAGIGASVGSLLMLLSRFSVVASAGILAYGLGRLVDDKTDWFKNLGGWIYDKTHDNIDLKGGFVPGTVEGLGSSRSVGSAAPAGSVDKESYLTSLEKKFGLPAGLLDAVWLQESSRGKNKGLSKAGALGDFQQMPDTAAAYGVLDRTDFGQSAMAAARMYRDLLAQYKGNLPMALAAYNEGSGNLARRGMGNLPIETQGYVRSIMDNVSGRRAGVDSGVHIDRIANQITVQTVSSDARGIAQELGLNLRRRVIAAQANTGIE